jgi:hypothetical protein
MILDQTSKTSTSDCCDLLNYNAAVFIDEFTSLVCSTLRSLRASPSDQTAIQVARHYYDSYIELQSHRHVESDLDPLHSTYVDLLNCPPQTLTKDHGPSADPMNLSNRPPNEVRDIFAAVLAFPAVAGRLARLLRPPPRPPAQWPGRPTIHDFSRAGEAIMLLRPRDPWLEVTTPAVTALYERSYALHTPASPDGVLAELLQLHHLLSGTS